MKKPAEIATDAMTGLAPGYPVDPEVVKELIEGVIETDRGQRAASSTPLYAWSMVGQSWSDDPYFVASGWPSRPITVIASDKQSAINEAARALGSAGSGRHWKFTEIEAKDVRLMTRTGEEKQ